MAESNYRVWDVAIEIDGTQYVPVSVELSDAIFAIPRMVCTLVDTDGKPPAPDELLGANLVAKVFLQVDPSTVYREFSGIIVTAEKIYARDGIRTEIEVAPNIWKLTQRADCRVFRDQGVKDIVQDVFDRGGVENVRWELGEEPAPREHLVQYRETDLEFVERLLSESGIYYAIEFADGVDTVVLSDDIAGLGPVVGEAELGFNDDGGTHTDANVVLQVHRGHRKKSTKAMVRDYDFEQPRKYVDGETGSEGDEVYDHPARRLDKSESDTYATTWLDSLAVGHDKVWGRVSEGHLTPGRTFKIVNHPYERLNVELLVTRVVITIAIKRMFETQESDDSAPNFNCDFDSVVVETTPYRPPRRERPQNMVGLQFAKVVGPSGEEIHSDEHGRVKARYFWDREWPEDDTSSGWMRTSQMALGGSMLLPRTGWEVTVQHDEGDPDVPLVMARLYNGETRPPYPLPEGALKSSIQTATTPGGGSSNEFRMDDSGGAEGMMINASRDLAITVINNTTEQIGNNLTREIGGNRELAITNSHEVMVGSCQTIDIGGNQTVNVETFRVEQCGGDYSLTVAGNRDMKVGGDHKCTVEGDRSIEVGSMSTDLVVGEVSEKVLGDSTLDVSAARALITCGDHATLIAGDHTETATAAKIVVTFGGRSVEVGGTMMHKVAGAILSKVDGDRSVAAGATFTEVAGGAGIVKAENITYEATGLLTLVMGASVVILTPASASIAGVSVKLDGAVKETAALILNN